MEPITIIATAVGIATGSIATLIAVSRARIETKKLRLEVEKLSLELEGQRSSDIWIPRNEQSAIDELERYLRQIAKINNYQLYQNHKFTKWEIKQTRKLSHELKSVREYGQGKDFICANRQSLTVIGQITENLEEILDWKVANF